MNTKVVLISIDGMCPDGVLQCGHPFVKKLMEWGTYTLQGKTELPSVTLPYHTSMFYSLPPERHGILTNTYTPPVRPVDGIVELLHRANKKSFAPGQKLERASIIDIAPTVARLMNLESPKEWRGKPAPIVFVRNDL